jgi:hypothetical protein
MVGQVTRREDIIPLVRDTIQQAQTKLAQAEALLRDNGFPETADDLTPAKGWLQVWTKPDGRLSYMEKPDAGQGT